MLVIKVAERENIDRALKRFKKKVEQSGKLKKLKQKVHFQKPSVKRKVWRSKCFHKHRVLQRQAE